MGDKGGLRECPSVAVLHSVSNVVYTFFHGSPNTNELEHPSKQKKIPKKVVFANTNSSNTKQADRSPKVFFSFFFTFGKTTSVRVKTMGSWL